MPQATITVKYANPPRGNARSATLKDSDGGYWGVHPGSLGRFQVGQTYTVDYVERTGNDGRVYKNVTKILGQETRGQQAPQQRSAGGQRPPQQSEDIFVTTVVQSAIAQQYPLEQGQLSMLVQMARKAWRGEAADEPPPPVSEDNYGSGPDDPIPF